MGRSFYTFIVVPNTSSRLHKLKLPVRILRVLAGIGFLSFFVVVGLGFNYAKMAFKAADYDKLQSENTNLKVQKKNLEVAALKLSEKITNLETVSARIQSLIENEGPPKRGKLNTAAVGGSTVDYPTAELLRSANIKDGLNMLKTQVAGMEGTFSILDDVMQKRSRDRQFTPSLWPVKGAITSHYGNRADPFNGEAEMHLGLDISALFGARILAPADGRVIFAERKAAYGNLIVIDHGNGLTTRYGHLSRFLVKVGQKVKKNETVIGLVGNTGRTTAPHLHYEVRLNDRAVNPRTYLPKG